MDSWITYAEYTARYPDTTLTEAGFIPVAADAALVIMDATHWRAAIADDDESLARLQDCQAQLLHLSTGMGSAGGGWDGVSSVSNHGYTESYASGADQQTYLQRQQLQIIERTLGAPATRWMLYQGGVYRPPRRH